MTKMSAGTGNETGNPLDKFQGFYLDKAFAGVGSLWKAIMNPRAIPSQILARKARFFIKCK